MAKALADMSDSEFKAAFRKWCAPPLVGYSYPTVTFPVTDTATFNETFTISAGTGSIEIIRTGGTCT